MSCNTVCESSLILIKNSPIGQESIIYTRADSQACKKARPSEKIAKKQSHHLFAKWLHSASKQTLSSSISPYKYTQVMHVSKYFRQWQGTKNLPPPTPIPRRNTSPANLAARSRSSSQTKVWRGKKVHTHASRRRLRSLDSIITASSSERAHFRNQGAYKENARPRFHEKPPVIPPLLLLFFCSLISPATAASTRVFCRLVFGWLLFFFSSGRCALAYGMMKLLLSSGRAWFSI